jgi:hypothetical protein
MAGAAEGVGLDNWSIHSFATDCMLAPQELWKSPEVSFSNFLAAPLPWPRLCVLSDE